MDKRFEDKIADKLYKHTTPPPAVIWELLERDLPTAPLVRQPLWRSRWVAAASLLLVGSTSLLIHQLAKQQDEVVQIAQLPQQEVTPFRELLHSRGGEGPRDAKRLLSVANRGSSKSLEVDALNSEDPIIDAVATTLHDDLPMSQVESQRTEEEIREAVRRFEAAGRTDAYAATHLRKPARQANSPMALGLQLSNGVGSNHSVGEGFATLRQSESQEFVRMVRAMADPKSEVDTKVNHRMPISAGIRLQKQLTSRWGVETGVVYTYMSSQLTDESVNRRESQQLHYLGIPLNVNYQLYRVGPVSFYGKAGGQIDFNIAGNWNEQLNYRADYGSGQIESFSRKLERRPQLSVNLAAGVSVDLFKSFQLYAEPSVAHFFDNKSQIVNVRKDRPTDFALQLGARLLF